MEPTIFQELFVKVSGRITVHFTKFRYLYYSQLCVLYMYRVRQTV